MEISPLIIKKKLKNIVNAFCSELRIKHQNNKLPGYPEYSVLRIPVFNK